MLLLLCFQYIFDRIQVAQIAKPAALIGDIKSCTVINRCAQDGEIERDIDPLVEIECFEGSEALVVVHSDIVGVLCSGVGYEGYIGNQRVGEDIFFQGLMSICDRFFDDLLFIAENTIISCVRVEAEDGDFWVAGCGLRVPGFKRLY